MRAPFALVSALPSSPSEFARGGPPPSMSEFFFARSDDEEVAMLAAAVAASLAELSLDESLGQGPVGASSASSSAAAAAEPEPEAAPGAAAVPLDHGVAWVVDSQGVVHGTVPLRAPAWAPEPRPARAEPRPKAAPCGPPQPGPAPGSGSWVYAVWHIPGQPQCTGVHCGGGRAWNALRGFLPGGRYSYVSGCRLRRFESEADGIVAYTAESAVQGVPRVPNIFRW